MPHTQDAPVAAHAAGQARYDSIMVQVEPGIVSSRRTEVAARLARRFDARLIGIGAEAIEPLPPADPYGGLLTADWLAAVMAQVDTDLQNAEEAFRRDAAGVTSEWRAFKEFPAAALARSARAADLIVAGGGDGERDTYRRADPGDLVMQAGRPVLVAPKGASHLHGTSILIAWKDTREARRAVADALPLLATAEDIVVMAVCDEAAVEAATGQTADVVQALRHRGLPARANVITAPDASVADELNAEASAIGADLIVMGAYGQSRIREWALGGATRDMLRNPQRFLLLSH